MSNKKIYSQVAEVALNENQEIVIKQKSSFLYLLANAVMSPKNEDETTVVCRLADVTEFDARTSFIFGNTFTIAMNGAAYVLEMRSHADWANAVIAFDKMGLDHDKCTSVGHFAHTA